MLFSFEGVDGCGKSTQAQLLAESLEAEGHRVLLFREPGGTDLSERVRALLLDPSVSIEPFAEMLLFSAARAQLVAERVRPALLEGSVVLLDRFFDSTIAYQGAGRGLGDPEWLRAFNMRVTDGLVPARTYLIELDPEEALHRRRARRDAASEEDDRMEGAGLTFQARVGDAYAAIAAREPDRILRLDGTAPVKVLHERIRADAASMLLRGNGTRL